jgi:predicted aspartyl protease
MSDRHLYDATYHPPFPTLSITVTEPLSARTVGPFQALLDTGSDITVIPARLLSELSLQEFRLATIQGYGAEPARVPTYLLDVNINGHTIEFVEVILEENDGGELLLGRNVLNELTVVLDGPALQVEVK